MRNQRGHRPRRQKAARAHKARDTAPKSALYGFGGRVWNESYKMYEIYEI
jgi:hypothetical protein